LFLPSGLFFSSTFSSFEKCFSHRESFEYAGRPYTLLKQRENKKEDIFGWK